jgi:hypothetical protein
MRFLKHAYFLKRYIFKNLHLLNAYHIFKVIKMKDIMELLYIIHNFTKASDIIHKNVYIYKCHFCRNPIFEIIYASE